MDWYEMIILSWVLWILLLLPLLYWFSLAVASIKAPPCPNNGNRIPQTRFALAIPAHNEEAVISETVQRLLQMDYPAELFRVCIVADYCDDQTAFLARQAGALVFERNTGKRTGKGAALQWLFQQVLQEPGLDAIVVFDADTLVDPSFLRIMDARLANGSQVIQGQHVISNPSDGWFPALTWAMFLIDNRYQNLGRVNLGLSAKHMGDSICFQTDVLRKLGWGEGLTEDYQLRHRLVLAGYRIDYEHQAKGYGEAPLGWEQARKQRLRWLKGTRESNRGNIRQMLAAAIRERSMAIMDCVLQAVIPSFSTIAVFAMGFLILQVLVNLILPDPIFPRNVLIAWICLVVLAFFYPMGGLLLEKAPLKAYLVILTGPFFILWRTILVLRIFLGKGEISWVRTQHGRKKAD